MGKRMAIVRISKELLCQLLNFPEGTEIHAVRDSCDYLGIVEMQVSHEDLPMIRNNDALAHATPRYGRDENGQTKFIEWGL